MIAGLNGRPTLFLRRGWSAERLFEPLLDYRMESERMRHSISLA
jgi:hypothetical protein